MNLNQGESIVFEGFLHKRESGRLILQLYPGLMIDLDEKSCNSVEEAADPVSGKTHIRITLTPDADINATFQPRLARLALSNQSGVPFSMGGLPQGVRSGPLYIAPQLPIGGGGSGVTMYPYNTPSVGQFPSNSTSIWHTGLSQDDVNTTDILQDSSSDPTGAA